MAYKVMCQTSMTKGVVTVQTYESLEVATSHADTIASRDGYPVEVFDTVNRRVVYRAAPDKK